MIKVSNAFIAAGETHHKALSQHHSDLGEHHAAISEHHKAENPLLHKLHARIARCHAAISECHKARAAAYQNASSGLDEESRSFLADTSQGELHRSAADDLELDPELSDLVKSE
jgi:hypothetical protein